MTFPCKPCATVDLGLIIQALLLQIPREKSLGSPNRFYHYIYSTLHIRQSLAPTHIILEETSTCQTSSDHRLPFHGYQIEI